MEDNPIHKWIEEFVLASQYEITQIGSPTVEMVPAPSFESFEDDTFALKYTQRFRIVRKES